MSSSNLVRLAYIAETDYGVTPVSGDFKTARFISESLSGTPQTTESAQIRTDRQSSGQVVTGLEVGGTLDFELAKEEPIEDFMEAAMESTWTTLNLVTRPMTIDAGDGTATSVSGSFITDGLKVGDFVTFGGFASAKNNVTVMLTAVGALLLTFVGPEGMVDGTGTTTTYKRADKLVIGIEKKSFSMEKLFLDLDEKSINYKGMLVSSMELNVAYGSLISGSFEFSGNDHDTVDADADAMTFGRTIEDQATTSTLNGSVDMPFLATNASGTFTTDGMCIQSLDLSLNNNLTPQQCIGRAAPEGYNAGTAAITIDLSSYLKDGNWELLERKLTQDSFAIGFVVKNSSGGYGFYLPAVQVSFEDPSSGGANQDISLDMSGTAKVGPAGESALTVYRIA